MAVSKERFLEYNKFIADIETMNMSWALELKDSGCTIMVSFLFNHSVGTTWEYSKWCEENCNEKYYVYNQCYVFFKTEADAIAFKLRWA